MILTRRSAVRLLVAAPAMALGQRAASSLIRESSPAASRTSEIIVVCKTHLDMGSSDRVANVLAFYRTTMIDRALDLIDRSKELRKNNSSGHVPVGVFDQIVEDWPGQAVERRQRVDRAMRAGRLVAQPIAVHVG